MHIKTFALNTHDASHKTYPKLPILTFSPSTAPHSSNPIPFSDAYWLPKGLSFVMPRPLIRSLPPFLSFAFLLSMMRHSKADNPDLPYSLHSSLAFASRSSPGVKYQSFCVCLGVNGLGPSQVYLDPTTCYQLAHGGLHIEPATCYRLAQRGVT